MKVKVIHPFYDNNGVHLVGEFAEVESFDAFSMEEVKEEKRLPKKKVKESKDAE